MGPSTAYVMRKSGRVEAHQEGNSRYAKKQPHFCEALLNANKPNTALSAVGSCHFTISLYSVFQSYSRSNFFRPNASFSVHILLLVCFLSRVLSISACIRIFLLSCPSLSMLFCYSRNSSVTLLLLARLQHPLWYPSANTLFHTRIKSCSFVYVYIHIYLLLSHLSTMI